MGQNSAKPIVIEFNGIPGSGKTTTMYEVKKMLREMKIKEIPSPKVGSGQMDKASHTGFKSLLFSKELRKMYILFLKAFLLVRPLTKERWGFMNLTYGYWYRAKKMEMLNRQGICIWDQGIIQGFISMAYQGKITNETKYYKYIGRLMDDLGCVICINCNIDVETAMKRMTTRKLSGGRLYHIKTDRELREALMTQKEQFEMLRKISVKNSLDIDMADDIGQNAKKIIKFCV